MKVAIVYCYPLINPRVYFPLAKRFADTWRNYPPHSEHALYLGFNGGLPGPINERLFEGIPHSTFSHDNTGWDIGLYQRFAETVPCDLLICLGAPAHFHRDGWLERIVDTYLENGPGLYGCTAYEGPVTHVRTTLFWITPQVFRAYPYLVGTTRASRYDFEHGPQHSITRFAVNAGVSCSMVTWTGVYPFGNWHDHVPDAGTILIRDQHIHL